MNLTFLKRTLAIVCAGALALSLARGADISTQAATTKVVTKKYTISKKAGTYNKSVNVKVKAKKGYKVYYAKQNAALSKKNVIKSKKVKSFTFKKTTKLKIFAVKSSKKVTAKYLKSKKVQKNTKTYKYTIKSDSSEQSDEDEAEQETVAVEDSQLIDLSNVDSINNSAVSIQETSGITCVDIAAAGNYTITGGSASNPVKGVCITVNEANASFSDAIYLLLDNLYIDNSSYTSDLPAITINGDDMSAYIVLFGDSSIKGCGAYLSAPASALIYASSKSSIITLAASSEDTDATLTLSDAMSSTADFGSNDPSDGIASKGGLKISSGTLTINSNGECLKGTNKGVSISGGTLLLSSSLGGAIKSKSSDVTISGGTIKTVSTADDAINAKSATASISGGTIDINECEGDGIQAENVDISGGDIDIETTYEYAGETFYTSSKNTLTESGSTKTETVKYDTGSHKGIKGGTKECTYSYDSVESGSDYTAGQTYSQSASGGITISGGTIDIDTTKSGLKANSATSSDTTLEATGTGVYIIGGPDDGIHSNNTLDISGGTITVAAADDAVTSADTLNITKDADVTVTTAYEGVEGGTIVIGSGSDSPSVKVYTNDDGINASSKTTVYQYADEDEEQYVKTTTTKSNNTLTIKSGYVNVTIGDDKSHSIALQNDTSTVNVSYTSDGDGIDCNGSLNITGGDVVVWGATSNDNAPIDVDNNFVLGSGASVLAVGVNGMNEGTPTTANQAYVVAGGSSAMGGDRPSGDFGGRMSSSALLNGPGGDNNTSSSLSISSGSAFAITGSSEVLVAAKAFKNLTYVFYSSPKLSSSGSYSLVSGGSVSDVASGYAYDARYNTYTASGADETVSLSVTN